MTAEYILEHDKLIAEFMGVEVWQDSEFPMLWSGDLSDETLEVVSYMQWQRLMMVLIKIENMGFITEAHNEKPGGYYHFKITNGRNPAFTGFDLESRISSIYWAIVGFIEFYNLNVKK